MGGCGGGDGPGRWLWDHIPFRGREARAVLDLTPSDLCVCGLLPTHKGLPEMLPLCLAGSEPRSQGPVSHGQLSGGCKEHVDELQHAGVVQQTDSLPGSRAWCRVTVHAHGGRMLWTNVIHTLSQHLVFP